MSHKPITALPRHRCPDGVYKAKLTNARFYSKSAGHDRVQFIFELLEGPNKGITLMRTTGLSMSEKSHRYQITKALAGSGTTDMFGFAVGSLQLEELVGHMAMLLVRTPRISKVLSSTTVLCSRTSVGGRSMTQKAKAKAKAKAKEPAQGLSACVPATAYQ